jgi:hypothetical protein
MNCANRWRKALKAEPDYERTLDEARRRCARICEQRLGVARCARVRVVASWGHPWF